MFIVLRGDFPEGNFQPLNLHHRLLHQSDEGGFTRADIPGIDSGFLPTLLARLESAVKTLHGIVAEAMGRQSVTGGSAPWAWLKTVQQLRERRELGKDVGHWNPVLTLVETIPLPPSPRM
ncbi:MAG TPA: hypothetical protein VHW09_27310 [Bryobacteraceae bacterium]|jgi:hypothetical protein|nr:hypothetical protein [Bryobacteraceae bacterium]